MKTKIHILILFSLPFLGFAQMVNTGKLTIAENAILSTKEAFKNIQTGTLINEGNVYAYSHWENNGMVDFLNTTGTTHFVGTATQNITGSSTNYFYNVLFNNTATTPSFQLASSMSVKSGAFFNNGIVDNTTHGGLFIFQQNAFHSSTSNNSFVNGFVNKVGNVGFKFPIGNKNKYRAAKITALIKNTDEIKARYFSENSNTLYAHTLKEEAIEYVDTNEYWEITQQTGTSNVMVTLTWADDTTSATITQAVSKTAIHIVRWDASKGNWVDEGGIVDGFNKSVTTISRVSGYGIFALALVKEKIIIPDDCLTVYNAISNNNDNKNDALKFNCIEKYPNNTVKVFNRYGVKVFDTKGYNNKDNLFKGFSDGRITIRREDKLPTGTYFYVLSYELNSKVFEKVGYLYITN